MAQRVNVVLVDDIDGADAAETVSFALDGVDYEIDLSEKHASELRNAFSLYVGHARRTGGRRKSGRRAWTRRRRRRHRRGDPRLGPGERLGRPRAGPGQRRGPRGVRRRQLNARVRRRPAADEDCSLSANALTPLWGNT